MMRGMRTTIDIPPMLHQRIMQYAAVQGQSFSTTATQAMMRGMATVDVPSTLHRSAVTGLLVVNSGHPVTSEDVADLIDEDAR